ncbi:Aste57867_20818 [Aphanomyces stellatus]|uniref:Dolichol-phosphate mannosyltransferase subunit 1 n=1 Tax=Aphanomyces stellatus TaxID=120398 RepID=A0A485LG18_9STRA|nr:hypothetical protein As57867_020750 [Aphanomyces stellatus]VFT97497.1 Aste57867_20818 [Aphanomyces stellatus]
MTDLRSRGAASSAITASIIVPTYKECANLKELVTRVFAALGARAATTEIIVVDDNSQDGSEDVIKALAATGLNTRIIVRTTERGLSSAVLRGFEEAKGSLLMCMDADLQHPPESVPDLLDAIDPAKGNAEFVIGTRYGANGFSVDKDWPLYRQVISSGARMLARPLSGLSDPMTGFFGVPATVLQRAKKSEVNPVGFKIALELFVKCRVQNHKEVPINFGVRVHGESKLSSKVIVLYLQHLFDLYNFAYPSLLFCIFIILFTIFLIKFV